jgi:UDP-arabinose 4-epimerase
MSSHVLVTGGGGYVGSHACKRLAAAGYKPVVLDDLSEGHRWAVKWGPLIVGDIGDRELVIDTIRSFNIQAVLHFAGRAYVSESIQQPRIYFNNNFAKTLVLLDSILDAGVDKLVFSSTCATYGDPQQLPITEDHPQRPINPYGVSKLMVEQALHWYRCAYGLRYVALRYFNAGGADLDGEIGEDHDPETHLIPRVIAVAQGKLPQVEIFGTDYETRDGTAVRDYVHVADLASAHVRALDRLIDGGNSVSINLGTGRGHSIREVISMAEKISGARVPVREAPRRLGDPAALVADPSRGETILQWRPKVSDLQTIVHSAWNWHRPRSVARAREPAPCSAKA